MTNDLLHHLSEEQIRHELRGFPRHTVETVLALKQTPTEDLLAQTIVQLLTFYLPSGVSTDLSGKSPSARLREDLGVDSLTFSEAAFKIEELFAVRIENAELMEITTIAELQTFAKTKLLEKQTIAS